ncbi:DUF664 domain-containing protein [Aeromicrobium sp. YIM 150415]|uniref:DinB family protein n=1 Tax=Aeromicrobium sp. YIM 150415 TaxID=2803912 RepID=UPI001964B933|nr:DinB family protein [Aeromicrobium sp. YIM 150415]MBM9465650.1 DUF664 domain-containing protein [Aeromicrobium sp. YIM 150415]
MSTAPFPEPGSTDDLRGLLLDYLDYYRAVITDKLDGLGPDQLVSTNVPSGWTPAGLVNHLVHAERRWLVWGFLAEPVDDPWRDMAPSGGWVTLETRYDELERALLDAGRRTRAIVEEHDLTETAGVGGRFPDHASAPQLQWILLHLVQEYARHAGHLDIAREVLDGHGGAVTDP